MVEYDLLIREGPGEVEHVAELRLQQPGIESEAVISIGGEPLTKAIRSVQTFGRMKGRAEHFGIGIPRAGMADPLEASVAGREECLDHRTNAIAASKVGMSDDCRAWPVVAVKPAGPLRGDTIHELHFPHRLEGVGAARIVECAAFHENGTHDIVTRVRIGVQFVERIIGGTGDRFDEGVARFGESRDKRPQIPQMVMRIDDRQFGFEDFFGHRRHSLPCCPLMCPIARGFRDGTRTGGS